MLCGVAFPLMYMVPPGWGQQGIFVWFLVTALLMFTASTVLSVPWLSLSYELTPDSMERVRIQAYRTYIGAGVTMALPWIYRLAQEDFFGDTMTGMRWLSGLVGIAFMVCVLPVFLGTRERYMRTAGRQQKIGMGRAIRETARNRPFLLLVCGIVTTMLCAPMLVGSLGIYINSYHVFNGDTKSGAALLAAGSTLFVVIKLVILPGVVKLSARFGKRTVMRWSLILGLLGSISKFFFYTPSMPYLQFATIVLLCPSLTAFWLLVDPMKADCADYDEYRTGLRRAARGDDVHPAGGLQCGPEPRIRGRPGRPALLSARGGQDVRDPPGNGEAARRGVLTALFRRTSAPPGSVAQQLHLAKSSKAWRICMVKRPRPLQQALVRPREAKWRRTKPLN